MAKLTERELKILAGIHDMPGHYTARKIYRIGYVKSDAYKVVFGLWCKGLIRAPWLRLYVTDAGRAALGGQADD